MNLWKITSILNVGLVIECVFLTNTQNYHWDIVDPTCNDLHKFLERQYELFETIVNQLAERIRSIGVKSIGLVKEFIDETRLLKQPYGYLNADKMLQNLLLDHESTIRELRKEGFRDL